MQATGKGGLSAIGKAVLLTAPIALMSLAWFAPAWWFKNRTVTVEPSATAEANGRRVFLNNCAYCHGPEGDGRGSAFVVPPARAFGRDKFKFASTLNGIPSDDDLLILLERGIPGSSMPAFPQLGDAERRACIEEVRRLSRRGIYNRMVDKALNEDDDPEPEKFARLAATLCHPGERLEIPEFPKATPEALARGSATFAKLCANCHGPQGRGDGPQVKDLKNDDGTPNIPRDLTQGLYKAGGEPERLYARIRLGIPGTPMPATDSISPEETIDLVLFLQSLVKPATEAKP